MPWTPRERDGDLRLAALHDTGLDCTPVRGSCDRRYTVRDADLGTPLRVRLTVNEPGQPHAFGVSEPTAIVIDKTYSIPTPGDAGANLRRGDADRARAGHLHLRRPDRPGHHARPGRPPLSFISPFPVVRIAGRFKGKRTQAHARHVNAPRGARIRSPARAAAAPTGAGPSPCKLDPRAALQRIYRPKATIEIRVTQPHKIGKYTRDQDADGQGAAAHRPLSDAREDPAREMPERLSFRATAYW